MESCAATACSRSRAKRGRYCKSHSKKLNKYGHPLGRPIPRNWLFHFAAQAMPVIVAHSTDHPGIKLALGELQSLLGAPHVLLGSRAGDHIARIAATAIEPRYVLAMVASVALFDRDQPRFLRDAKAYRFAIARAVLSLAPCPRSIAPRSRALDAIGSLMVTRYSALLAVILAAIDTTDRQARERAAAMSAPLPTL
ncbi:hypothetical protein [Reyranella sp.]|uniref:hypothetical protein n=1 Tax=Reyranella sp. TaxID=1929291 RepID=UPI003D0E845A